MQEVEYIEEIEKLLSEQRQQKKEYTDVAIAASKAQEDNSKLRQLIRDIVTDWRVAANRDLTDGQRKAYNKRIQELDI